MRRTTTLLVSFLLAISAGAQETPKLKPIRDKQLSEKIAPEVNKKGKWGYANEKGKYLIKAVFDRAEDFRIVNIQGYDTTFLAKVMIDGKWGILRRDGTFLVEPSFESLDSFQEGMSSFRMKNEYGIVSYTGEIKARNLQELEKFDASGTAWYKVDDRWGVMRRDGSVLFSPVYTSRPTEKLSEDLLKTESEDKYGVISLSQQRIILQPECDSVLVDGTCRNLIVFKRDGLFGCMNERGQILSQPRYDRISGMDPTDYRRILVKKDRLFGMIDNTGKEILPVIVRTDQFATPRSVIQFMDSRYSGYEEPFVFYEGDCYRYEEFDNHIYHDFNSDRYVRFAEFPDWMKKRLYESLDGRAAIDRWKRADAFRVYPEEGVRSWHFPFDEDEERHPYIEINREMSVRDYSQLEIPDGNDLNTVKINVGGETFPCGRWLARMYKSVDSKKIAAYDEAHGTRILYSWDSISFRFPKLIVYRDQLYFVADMYIDDRHMQRVFSMLSNKGESAFSVKEDGRLYDWENGVNDAVCNLAEMNDLLVLSSARGGGPSVSTALYSPAGKLVATLPDVFTTDIYGYPGKLRLFGIEDEEEKIVAYDYQTDTKQTVRRELPFDFEEESPVVYQDVYLSQDRETGLLKSIAVQSGSGCSPIMRYQMSEWDGRKIVAVSKNYWSDLDDAQWAFIPRKEGFLLHLGDVLFRILAIDETGIARYSVKYEDDPDESLRFGFIGFDEPFFTLAAFEEASGIIAGSANVKINGQWVSLTKSQLESFSNSGR